MDVDLGTNQTFHGITGSSSPGVVGSNGLLGTLVLGGFGFWIVNAGGPHLDVGRFTIGQGCRSRAARLGRLTNAFWQVNRRHLKSMMDIGNCHAKEYSRPIKVMKKK